MVAGELAGTWRRSTNRMTIAPWRDMTAAEREAIEAEAQTLPLPGVSGPMRVAWTG
jgi:hypothetical protein